MKITHCFDDKIKAKKNKNLLKIVEGENLHLVKMRFWNFVLKNMNTLQKADMNESTDSL